MKEAEITEEAVLEGAAILEKATEEKSNGKDKDKKHIVYSIPWGATTFDEVEEYTKSQVVGERTGELTRIFQDLVDNIMFDDEIADKGPAITALTKEFTGRIAEVVAAGGDGIGIVSGVLQFFKDKLPKKKETPKNGLTIWKEGDRYRWVSIFTNKFRDEDIPPEILAEAAHEQFVKEVEAGDHPYPELWHWHTPGTRYGVADLLHFDKDTGFMVASGWIDSGHEGEAETIMALDEPIKTSHGMPEDFIKREDEDKTIITNYVSREISDLPARYAANQLTGFSILKEVEEKMIPEEKKDYFRKVGMSDEAIAALEVDMGAKAKEAEGLEFKETDEVTEPTETPAVVEEPGVEAEPYATREEVAEAIVETVKPIVEAVEAIAEGMKELKKSDETKIAEVAADIPAASIGAIIAKNFSVIGTDKAKVDGRTTEAKDGPEETDSTKAVTHIKFIDEMLSQE